eukprot:Gb_21787 [translate_table: standard]
MLMLRWFTLLLRPKSRLVCTWFFAFSLENFHRFSSPRLNSSSHICSTPVLALGDATGARNALFKDSPRLCSQCFGAPNALLLQCGVPNCYALMSPHNNVQFTTRPLLQAMCVLCLATSHKYLLLGAAMVLQSSDGPPPVLCSSEQQPVLCMQNCKVAIQIEAKLTVSSFGPDSGGSKEQTASSSVVQNSPFGKKWLVEERRSIGLFFSQKPPIFVPFKAPVP